MGRDTPLSAEQDVLVDASIFYAIGRPPNPQYQRLRSAVQHAGVVCKLPRRVIGELGGSETDRVRSKPERSLAHGLSEVRRIVSALEPSESIRDQACRLFGSARAEDLLRGRSIEAMAAASVYGACRCDGRPQTLDGVTDAARVEHSRVTNASRR